MKTFRLHIVTPTRDLDLGNCGYLRAPSPDGLFGVMAGHRNAVFAIDVGSVKVVKDGEEIFFAVGKGFAEVTGAQVQLLTESVERSDEIDIRRAQAALQRARERLGQKEIRFDRERAETALSRAINRLQTAQKS